MTELYLLHSLHSLTALKILKTGKFVTNRTLEFVHSFKTLNILTFSLTLLS